MGTEEKVNPPKLGVNKDETVDKIPILMMMIGLPGSGKSSIAEKMVFESGKPNIHSSDKLREELYGDADTQAHNDTLFVELHRRIKEDLRNGINVIYDATNISKKRRAAFLRELTNIPCKRSCIMVMTPYERCVDLNNSRERKVPEEVIRRMIMNWNPPHYSEGWDDISIVLNMGEDDDNSNWDLKTLFEGDCGIDNFNQENSHHQLTLGEHCRKTADYILEKAPNNIRLQMAALLHDQGKIMTKSRINSKGEDDGNCHYYQHHCVGAYNSVFYTVNAGFEVSDIIHISNLIYYHMHPYTTWNQSKSVERRNRIQIGELLYDEIMLLHEADVYAH